MARAATNAASRGGDPALKRRGYLAPVVIAVAVAVAMLLLGRSDFLNRFELRMLDYRIVLRDQVSEPAPVSRDIVLVLVDQDALTALKEPIPLWLPYYARLTKGVLDAGATAVGLDFVLAYAQPDQLALLGTTLLSAPEGRRPYTERLVLIGFLEQDERTDRMHLVKPVDELVALIGAPNVALANLTRDADGIPRAQQIFPFAVQDAANATWSPFAALLAEKHTGRTFDATTRTFGGEPLPLLDDGRLLINWTGAQPRFQRLSFKEVLDHTDDAGWMKAHFDGKVVLVGPGAFAFQDLTETPYSTSGSDSRTVLTARSARSMLGIEAQANVLNTLLTGAWLRRASPTANALFVLLACLLAGAVAWRLSAARGALVSLLLMAAVFATGFVAFTRLHVWLDVAAPMAAIPLVWGGVYARRYAVEEKEKRQIRGIFGKYVSKEVMEELLADPENLRLGGERREITVFFSDINGFTTTSEERPPEEVVTMLNNYLGEMARIVFEHNGTLEQFVGDEIMVLFGAPRPHPHPERAAVQMALDMVARLEVLRASDREENEGFYKVKVGIHTGRPIIGNIGTAERVQYTAIGDMVNLASRIMNMTKVVGGTILISEHVYERVKDMSHVEFIDHGEHEVRGRQSSVRIYEARARGHQQEVQDP